MTREMRAPLLVPLDGSLPGADVLSAAEVVADLVDAELDVLSVSEQPLTPDEVVLRARVPADWLPRVRLHTAGGDPGQAIVRCARDLNARAILLSSHGETGNLGEPAGHVTLDVLRDPPCPVYILLSTVSLHAQQRRLRHLRRILTPLDGTAEANQAVEYAADLAVRANARLLMLHVMGHDPAFARRHVAPAYSDQSHHELEAWREEFERRGFATIQRPVALNAEAVLRAGDPSRVIVDYANEQDCDLIVAAWGGSLSPGRAEVVRRMLTQARCPLLFLRATVQRPAAME